MDAAVRQGTPVGLFASDEEIGEVLRTKVHFCEESHQYIKEIEMEKSRVKVLDDQKKNTEKR